MLVWASVLFVGNIYSQNKLAVDIIQTINGEYVDVEESFFEQCLSKQNIVNDEISIRRRVPSGPTAMVLPAPSFTTPQLLIPSLHAALKTQYYLLKKPLQIRGYGYLYLFYLY